MSRAKTLLSYSARRRLRYFGGYFGLALLLTIFVCAVAPGWLAPHDPFQQNLRATGLPPFWMDGANPVHPLGTDQLGRDLMSRLIYATRVSVLVGVGAVTLQLLIGVPAGVVAAMRGGRVDDLIMRVADIWFAVPLLVVALAVLAILGGGLLTTTMVLGVTGWVTFARIARSEVLTLRDREFVLAARAFGSSESRIVAEHILKNIAASIIVLATLQMSNMIVVEASLSFLGVGIQPPTPAWGSMISAGRDYLYNQWWQPVLPGLALMLTTLAINLVGDMLRDVLDPSLRS